MKDLVHLPQEFESQRFCPGVRSSTSNYQSRVKFSHPSMATPHVGY
jgi:hypothetical protein